MTYEMRMKDIREESLAEGEAKGREFHPKGGAISTLSVGSSDTVVCSTVTS